MKIKIVENLNKDNDLSFDSKVTPLSYRVSLRLNNDSITLKREYFRVGFVSGEGHGRYYYDCDDKWASNIPLTYASFITRDVDNDRLKLDAELKLIKTFRDKCLSSKNKENKRILNEINRSNILIKKYDITYNCLDNYDRKIKINKIIEGIKIKQNENKNC